MCHLLLRLVLPLYVMCGLSCSMLDVDYSIDLETSVDRCFYRYGGDGRLKIISRYQGDSDYDIIQEWDYDLQQSLDLIYTFSNVYLRKKGDSEIGKPDKVEIMSQSSDCILATRLNRFDNYSGRAEKDNTYCSGNHCMDYKGKLYKTGETTSVSIYANDKRIERLSEGYADSLLIIVSTVAYNPFVLYDSLEKNETSPVYSPQFIETIEYRVRRGTIHCSVDRKYLQKTNIETYGGFASMSVDLKYAYFPCGHTMDNAGDDGFGELVKNVGLKNEACNKANFPDFNHFIKRNTEKSVYECVYLPSTAGLNQQ